MNRIVGAALLLGVMAGLSGCEMTMRVDKTDEVRMVDPSGNTVIKTTWRYADGDQVTTTNVVDQQGNETRKEYPPRRTTFVDF